MNVLKNVKTSILKTREEKIIPKCMNCGKPIENPEGPFGRRFCSDKCKKEYMG